MPIYKAPIDEAMFLLQDVFGIERHRDLSGFSDVSSETLRAILEEGAKLCEESFLPINLSGDREGCRRNADGSVTTPSGFCQAYAAYAQGGWMGLAMPEAFGGQNLPATLNMLMLEFVSSANLALAMYPSLTQGAIMTLLAHGTQDQKTRFVPAMVEGRWTGTMNLTEPQCGTDLGLIRTRAVKQDDGSYALTGQKIFISAGEHDLAENIVHLVLARIEGAPSGTKGISLFVCPKILVEDNGSLGGRNSLSCGKIEEKMGIHANATCVMDYDGARAWLVGEENRGLAAMFTMMNEARIVVGIEGLALSEVAYQNAAAYARERLQGRSLSGSKAPGKPADPIIVHADVRRNLMTIRALKDAGRALVVWTALQADCLHRSSDPEVRQKAEDHLGLMTPIIKGCLTDQGFENAVRAQQVLGGHGYIREWGLEQFVRDARITMIYEGANGIQALDLVARKLPKDGGRAMKAFLTAVNAYVSERKSEEPLAPYLQPLNAGLTHLQQATLWFMQNAIARPDHAGAGSTDYLHLFGLVAMGYMWAQMAEAALNKPGEPQMAARLATARFFMDKLLPETALRLARIQAGADSVMALPAEMF